MPLTITHATVAGNPQSPLLDDSDWNADHILTGSIAISDVDGLQTALDGKQPLATVLTNTTASFTTALETKLNGIEAGADVTDAANVAAAGAVMESDYSPAHSVLVQQSGTGSPSALQISNNTLLGRLSGGGSNIAALSASDVRTLLSINNVDNTSDLNKPISTATQTALDGKIDEVTSTDNAIVRFNGTGGAVQNGVITIDDGGAFFIPDYAGTPPTPVGGLNLFTRSRVNRRLPAIVGPSGVQTRLQTFLGANRIGLWAAAGGTTVTAFGMSGAATGTATAKNPTSTNLFTQSRRIAYRSAATAGSAAGLRGNLLQNWRGNATGLGGFHFTAQFGVGDAAEVADARNFVGLQGAAAVIGNVNPSTLTNLLGFGSDNAEANLSFMHNDGAGAAKKIPLGANFPANTRSTDWYHVEMFCAPNGSEIFYYIENMTTGNTASGGVTTDIPAATTFLSYQLWRNNGATALAVDLDINFVYLESDI